MKKAIIVGAALALALAFSLAGCSSQQEEPAPDQGATVTWTNATSAQEAAEGAGIPSFGVFDKMTVGDIEFANPTFSYAKGVARANYETGAAMLYLCKADGAHEDPLTERDPAEFAVKWDKDFEGLSAQLYGTARGAATYVTWKDGTAEYGVTIQGLGGEELSMETDEVATIVKAVHDANAPKQESPAADKQGQYITEAAAKDAAIKALGIGTPKETSCELKVGGDAPHYLVTMKYADGTRTIQIDALSGQAWMETVTLETPSSSDASSGSNASSDSSNYIAENVAKDAAIASVGKGNPDSASAELKIGGDAPHYDVTLKYGSDTQVIQVDAVTGDVWQD